MNHIFLVCLRAVVFIDLIRTLKFTLRTNLVFLATFDNFFAEVEISNWMGMQKIYILTNLETLSLETLSFLCFKILKYWYAVLMWIQCVQKCFELNKWLGERSTFSSCKNALDFDVRTNRSKQGLNEADAQYDSTGEYTWAVLIISSWRLHTRYIEMSEYLCEKLVSKTFLIKFNLLKLIHVSWDKVETFFIEQYLQSLTLDFIALDIGWKILMNTII